MNLNNFFSKKKNILSVIALILIILVLVYLYSSSQAPQWNGSVPSDLKITFDEFVSEHGNIYYFVEVDASGRIISGYKELDESKTYIEKEGTLTEVELKALLNEFYQKKFFTMPQEYKSIFNNENSPNTLSINLNGQKYSVKEFDDSGSENFQELKNYLTQKSEQQQKKEYLCENDSECLRLVCIFGGRGSYCNNGVCECAPDLPL